MQRETNQKKRLKVLPWFVPCLRCITACPNVLQPFGFSSAITGLRCLINLKDMEVKTRNNAVILY